jgi:hypothetical protein
MAIPESISKAAEALAEAIKTNAPVFEGKLTLIVAKINLARATQGLPIQTTPEFIVELLMNHAIAEDSQRRQKDIEALKTQEAQQSMAVEQASIRESLWG